VQTYFGSYFVCSSTLDKKSMSHRAFCVAPGDTLDVLEMAWLDSRRVIYLLTLCSFVCQTKCFNAQEVGIIIQWALKLETLYWVSYNYLSLQKGLMLLTIFIGPGTPRCCMADADSSPLHGQVYDIQCLTKDNDPGWHLNLWFNTFYSLRFITIEWLSMFIMDNNLLYVFAVMGVVVSLVNFDGKFTSHSPWFLLTCQSIT
jgi:hypothetical protein